METPESKTVLIAEDDANLRRLFNKVLRPFGFFVQLAADGREAMTLLQARLPYILLLDIHMPYVSGLEVLAYVREIERDQHTYIIVMTSDHRAGETMKVDQADLLLLKPVDIHTLTRFVQQLGEVQAGDS